jgi:hypothetical protein
MTLSSCTLFSTTSSKDKPFNISGSFQVQMNIAVKHYQSTDQYPVSGKFVDNVTLYNQIIPAGSGLIGLYRNNGFSCTILWTGIIPLDSAQISNLNGVAISKCPAWGTLSESSVITAKWN